MDRKYHTDDFERMLREMSDEFRMFPSKRIWNSIYNHVHPGHKWPSVVMTISLIFTLIFVGHLNTSDATTGDVESASKPLAIVLTYPTPINRLGFTTQLPNQSTETGQQGIVMVSNNSNGKGLVKTNTVTHSKFPIPLSAKLTAATTGPAEVFEQRISVKKQAGYKSALIAANTAIYTSGSLIEQRIGMDAQESITQVEEAQSSFLALGQKTRIQNLPNIISVKEITDGYPDRDMNEILQDGIASLHNKQLVQNNQEMVSQKDREWIESYALYNRRAPKKWAGKLSWHAYATPSVVYRSLTSGSDFGNAISNPPYTIVAANQALNDAVHQIPAMGMEMGSGIQYSIVKGLSIKGSVQLNYTRYTTKAFENSHPFSTQITLRDFATNSTHEIYKTTPYSNKSGLEAVKLHNETFQLSLPIGADLKLAGNEKIQWNVGATIQPTFVMGGKNYLISSDKRNYVKESSLLSKWNLNAGFETFITFKSNELTWQIGPQFRTQLFSTNSKQYVVEERLFNYGIKLGVSKNIR